MSDKSCRGLRVARTAHRRLIAAKITSVFGRAPTIGSRQAQPGPVSNRSTPSRVVLSCSGHRHLTASDTRDGIERMNIKEEFSSSVQLDEALDVLVHQLT